MTGAKRAMTAEDDRLAFEAHKRDMSLALGRDAGDGQVARMPTERCMDTLLE